jgi:DNA-binding CsgD family transcriptional regulator
MGFQLSTLLDVLSSQQFRTAILLSLGLDTSQIADLLETSERTVCISLSDCFDRVGCRSAEGLAFRLSYEFENNLYDERLDEELALLQRAAKRMLENLTSATTLDTSVESNLLFATQSSKWIM